MKVTACVRGAIFAGRPVFFLLFRFVGDKEDDAVVDDERLFLVFLLLIDGWDLELGGRPVVACKYFFKLVPGNWYTVMNSFVKKLEREEVICLLNCQSLESAAANVISA